MRCRAGLWGVVGHLAVVSGAVTVGAAVKPTLGTYFPRLAWFCSKVRLASTGSSQHVRYGSKILCVY